MKLKIIKKLLFAFILIVSLAISLPISTANAQEKLDEDSVRFYDVYEIYSGEKITLCASNYVYELDLSLNSSDVIIHEVNNAKKAYSSNGSLVYLIANALYIDGVEITNGVIDFHAINGNVVYCGENGIFSYSQEEGQSILLYNNSNAFAITSNENDVYFATKQNGFTDVFKISNGETVLVHSKKRVFDKLVFDDKLYGIGSNTLYDFTTTTIIDVESESFTLINSTAYFLKSNNIYTKDGFVLGSGDKVFFPTDSSSCLGLLAVADYNGISIYSQEGEKYEKTQTIQAMANVCEICPHCPCIYYAYDNVLYKWKDGEIEQNQYPQTISDIAIDIYGNVYVSANGIYKNGEILYENLSGNVAINKANNSLLCYDGSAFYINGNVAFEKSNVISFDVDDDGYVFALLPNSTVEKINVMGATDKTYEFDLEEGVSLSILRSDGNAGKLSIVDKTAHNLIFSDSAIANVTTNVNVTIDDYDANFIRKTTAKTNVYSDMLQTTTLATFDENSTVFSLVYDVETNQNFSLVAFRKENGILTLGYVLKNDLSNTIGGEIPLYDTATTFYDDVHVLALPFNLEQAPNSKLLTIESKGTTVELISKISVFGYDWYKVRHDGIEGFVSAPSLQLGQYVPTIRPNVNATVNETCITYEKDGEIYVETDVFITKDTRVEIVGLFDSNVEFTLVKYYDSSAGGTRTCYVKTNALKYDYTTPEQQIALIVILVLSITTIIAVIIGVGVRKSKQH